MRKKYFHNNTLIIIVLFIMITAVFFYKTILMGYVPFPGDLLLAEYQPWRSYSFDGYNPGSIPNKAQYFDTLRQMYPWKTLSLQSIINNKDFPLWNPYNFSGSPLFANFQSAIMFPLNGLHMFFPQAVVWTLQVLLQPLLTLIITYALARQLGLSKLASVFSSVSYSFCMYMITFLEYNIMGHYLWILPLGLLGIEKIFSLKKIGLILILVSSVSAIFSGSLQLCVVTFIYLIFYLVIKNWICYKSLYSKNIIYGLSFLLIGVGIGSIQLLPTFELILNSARTVHEKKFIYSDLLIHFDKLILYLIPDIFGNPAVKNYLLPFSYPSKSLYVGVGALLLAFLSLMIKKKSASFISITSLTLVSFLLVFLTPLSQLLTELEIPFMNSSSVSNGLFLISFGLSVLAGFGFDYFLRNNSKKFILLPAALLIVTVISVLWLSLNSVPIRYNNVWYSLTVIFVSSALFVIGIIYPTYKRIILICITILACSDLWYFFHKFNPFVPSSYLYPQTEITSWLKTNAGISRFWGYGSAAIEANFATQFFIYSPDGYDPLYPKNYGKIIASSYTGRIPAFFDRYSRSDAVIPPGYGKLSMMENHYRLKLLSLLGVSYILDKTENGSTDQTFPPQYFENILEAGDFRILKYKMGQRRYFFTTHYDIYQNEDDLANKLYSPTFDPQSSILLPKAPNFPSNDALTNALVQNDIYGNRLASFSLSTSAPGIFYLSDTFFPGWKAFVNGKKTPILTANFAFKAVEIPKGNHQITFVYEPESFTYGSSITLISAAISIAIYRMINLRYDQTNNPELNKKSS